MSPGNKTGKQQEAPAAEARCKEEKLMFKFLRNLILACSIVLILPGTAAAEFSAVEFLKAYDSSTGDMKEMYLQYLNGVQNGISWANSLVERKFPQARTYCPPRKLKPTATGTVTILRQFVAEFPKNKAAPVGAAILLALKNKYPC